MEKSHKPNKPSKNEDSVMTPAGPRPKDQVHIVKSGEAVRMDEKGKNTVAPSQEASAKIKKQKMKSAEDQVLTPGGFLRLKSDVHLVEPGNVLRLTDGRLQKLDPSRRVLADFGAIRLPPKDMLFMPHQEVPKLRKVPGLGEGWIVNSGWSNNTGNPITSFSTTWIVPAPPTTQSGQLIYLFNGIQNSAMIYQPVLQWGNNGAFGGNYWVVASWYADGQSGAAYHTQPVQVNPGDVLVGIMTLTNQSGTSFDYNCEFQGIAQTSLPFQNIPELGWCCETLEAYWLSKCSDYPAAVYTAFQGIDIQTGAVNPTLNWGSSNNITDCGQHVVVMSNANPGGEVDIYYRGLLEHDLFLRDNLQDFGSEPTIGGGISCSPDIIVYNQELLDPEATLGSPTAQNDDTLGDQVEYDQDNFIYFRVQNRGNQPTSGKIKAYWANSSTLPTPNSWNPIEPTNEITIPPVNPGEFKVVGPMKWEMGDIPPIGHYCFVGLIDTVDDPAPDPTAIHNNDDYDRFIRKSNNVAWKNFNVVPQFPNSYTTLTFQIQSWPKQKLSADLKIDLSSLPNNFNVYLRILKRLTTGTKLENMELIEETDHYSKFELNAGKISTLKNMSLLPSDKSEASLEFIIPENASDDNHRISAAQIFDGREMGRVTLMIAIGKYPFMANSKTKELHVTDCNWAAKIAAHHKIAYSSIDRAIRHGYNGCRFCLPEYSTD